MKKKELNEFKKQTKQSIDKEIKRLREKLGETKIAIVSGKEPNFKAAKTLRRDIAQLLMIRNEAKDEEQKGGKVQKTGK